MSGVPPRRAESHPTADPTTRVRRMRVARGACWVIVAALAAATGFALLDAALRLPGWVRGLGLAAWVTGVGVLAWRAVVRPLQDAAAPEEPTPEARAELPGNLRAAASAALALVACLLAGAFVPGAVEHLRRVALPWHRPAASQYRVVVTSGDAVARANSPVTLTAYAEKTETSAATPESATLCVEHGTRTENTPMRGDGDGAFHAAVPFPAGTFRYRVEIAGAASEWFTVTSVDPVELADGSTTELAAPQYAPAAKGTPRPGLAPIDGVQNATAQFQFRFTRPAADAYLEFRPADGVPEPTRVSLADDRLSGSATLRLKQDGTLRLVTVAERDGKRLRVEGTPVTVRVKPDTPPRFERVAGVCPRPTTALPGTVLRIEFDAADDVAVTAAVLEWVAPDESRYASIPVPLTGDGAVRTGRIEFDLASKGRVGGTLRLRVRVFDSRKLDDPPLKPQEAAYPASGWAEVRLDPAAAPQEVQEVLARRDAVREGLDAAVRACGEAAVNIGTVLAESEGKADLAPDQVARLNNAREELRTAAARLADVSREAALSPELRAVALAARTIAGTHLKSADDNATRAATATPIDRQHFLTAALKNFTDASDRTGELAARCERIARDRLDSRALADLAADQAALAARTDLAPAERAKLQAELLARLRAMLADSAPLRSATDAAAQQEFDRLAAIASDVAGLLRDLNAATRELHAGARSQLASSILGEQRALAARAAQLLAKIDTATRLAQFKPPEPKEFAAIGELVAAGKNTDAMTAMEQQARVLDSWAAVFEKWAADRTDARVAARQLAMWQEDVWVRFRTAAADAGTLPRALAGFRTEQAALRGAVAALRVPPGDAAAIRTELLDHLAAADRALAGTGASADAAMKAALADLNRLAEKMPANAGRLTKARPEFDRLYREQEAIQLAVDAAVRNSEAASLAKKLAAFADRQKKQLAGFAGLDLPGLDSRRARLSAALAAAAVDLANAAWVDVPASQAWARREFDRLRTVLLDAQQPPDERADELARRVQEASRAVEELVGPRTESPRWAFLANAIDSLGPPVSPEKLAAHAAAFQDAFKQLPALRGPEASALHSDAVESVRTADFAFRNGSLPPDVARKARAAAADLSRLADRLSGAESDLDRVRRLAANRRTQSARRPAPGSPADPEVARQLSREFEELTHTRAGLAGQLHKKRALDEYARLRELPTPDRQAGAHARLAERLDELAALMADVEDLAAGFDRSPPAGPPNDADAYLPSRTLAEALRDLARDYRTARDRVSDLPGELAKWITPGKANPLADVERRQRELAADAAALADALAGVPAKLTADQHQPVADARLAADRLRTGSLPGARQAATAAAVVLRKLGESPAARPALGLADRQDAIVKEIAKFADVPGAAAAQQQALAGELAKLADELVRTLETAARDGGVDEAAAKALTEAAATARAAARLMAEGNAKVAAGKLDEAAALRAQAEAQFRAAGGTASGAGPAPTTLPTLDPETTALGEWLRRAELAMHLAARDPNGKPVPAADRATRTAADELARAAKTVSERVSAEK